MPKKYGQLIIGPPGSGKTTYCENVCKFYSQKMKISCGVINLDPANEKTGYTPIIDIRELITLEEVMDRLDLGPNGSLLYCLDYLYQNLDWLLSKLSQTEVQYVLFDLPGQSELYIHDSSVRNICLKLTDVINLCVVNLLDSHHCSDASKLISGLLFSLNSMLHLGLPQLNCLSKFDLLKEKQAELDFPLDFYTEVLNLEYLLDLLNESTFTKKYKKLNAALVGLIEDYSLVFFIPLEAHSEKSLNNLRGHIDKANGFVFGSEHQRSIQSLLSCAVGSRTQTELYDADAL